MIRRAIGTTLAGLCALTGPLAGGAFAATADSTLSTSTSSARPGVAFTVSPTGSGSGCPTDFGVQTVQLSFTDHAGGMHAVGSVTTEDDGSWAGATALLPVAGLDEDGEWSSTPVAAGAGTLEAACFAGADEAEDDSAGDGDSEDLGDDDSIDDPSDDDSGDPDAGDTDAPDTATRTYPGIALAAAGSAPKLTLSATLVKPGGSVTVTPAEGCVATGASVVSVALVSLGDPSDDGDGNEDSHSDDGDDGTGDDSGDEGDGSVDEGDGLPSASITTSATGTWTAATLVLPADAATGDYAVTADCSTGDTLTSSYDAAPLALGTVLIAPAVCGARSVSAALSGTYSGELAGLDGATLPAKLALTGDGPWKLKVRSATTGLQLASRTVACAKPQYELDVSKPGLSDSNKARARVCNTGRAPVTAVLQVLKGKKYAQADKETVNPGACVWLEGPKLGKGSQAKGKVLIDAPGKGSDDTVEAFTVKRGKH